MKEKKEETPETIADIEFLIGLVVDDRKFIEFLIRPVIPYV